MVWTVDSMDLKLNLYPNLAFGKYAIAQEDRTHGKNSSNGQDKLVQKRQLLFGLLGKPKFGNLVPYHTKEQLDMHQS